MKYEAGISNMILQRYNFRFKANMVPNWYFTKYEVFEMQQAF